MRLAARWPSERPAMPLAWSCPGPRPPKVCDGEREIQGEHDDGDRGSISDGERLEGGVKREECDDLSGDARSTVGQCLDHDESPERRHRDGEQSNGRVRPEA